MTEEIKQIMRSMKIDIVPHIRRDQRTGNIIETGVMIFSGEDSVAIIDCKISKITKINIQYYKEGFNYNAIDCIINYIIKTLRETKDAYSGCGGKNSHMYYLYNMIDKKEVK